MIGVTGQLGCSAAGLEMLSSQDREINSSRSHFISAHTRPIPRIGEGITLREIGVSTAMDVSDGLLADLGKLCQASGVGADIEIDLIPADGFLKKTYPKRWKELSITGGEDYELLFTGPDDAIEKMKQLIDIPISVIGEIVEGIPNVTVLDSNSKSIPINTKGGWDHFK